MNKYLVLALAGILVVTLGGTAAASGYVITKPSQIKPSVRNTLKGQRGPIGPEGAQGPKGEIGARGGTGATGPQGPKGDTGERGPQGPAGANGSDATRLGVLDAHGNRLGDYLSGADARGIGGALTFLNRSDERVYTIGTGNGTYAFPSVRVVFKTSNCSGPGYVHVSDVASRQNVFTWPDTGSPGDPTYVLDDTQQTVTYHSYYGLNGGGCWDTSSSPYSPIPAFEAKPIGTIPAAAPAPLRIG